MQDIPFFYFERVNTYPYRKNLIKNIKFSFGDAPNEKFFYGKNALFEMEPEENFMSTNAIIISSRIPFRVPGVLSYGFHNFNIVIWDSRRALFRL